MPTTQCWAVYGPHRPDLLREETLPDLFEATAARQPEARALVFGDQSLTYAQLDLASDYAAHHLIERGAAPGRIVGIWLPRGLDLLIVQLGVAKSGAAWLPFDADAPVQRVGLCLQDAGAVLLVTTLGRLNDLAHVDTPAVSSTTLLEKPTQPTRILRRQSLTPDHPAYLIYTSGSTGKPKGIVISHRSIAHFLRSENELLGVRAGDLVYQGFSVAFDMSFEEIWISYLVGAALWISDKSLASDPERLPPALTRAGVTVLHAVPTLVALFADDVPTLRLLNLGGETCPESVVERWATPERLVFNTYGPTETTVSASLARLRRGEPVTIGKPLPNYGLLVVNEQMELLAPNEVGELCIFGPGVATGYLGRPELTEKAFVANPWSRNKGEERLYKSGDLASIDENGQVFCLGRVDAQVKIRGFRVELGEIEARLSEEPGVGAAVVVLRKEHDLDVLAAFLVAEAEASIDLKGLRSSLRSSLPPYMVPSRYEMLPLMPRLPSGKVDRNLLRDRPLSAPDCEERGDEPETSSEIALFAVLSRMLPGQSVRRSDDFFDDLGGHSLLAARLASNLRELPPYRYLTIGALYAARTVEGIALHLDSIAATDAAAAPAPAALPSERKRWLCGLGQTLVFPLLAGLRVFQWLAPFFVYHFNTGEESDSVAFASAAALAVFLLVQVLALVAAVLARRIVLGSPAPGRYPMWGWVYFRWWLSDRITDSAPAHLLAGSPLASLFLRAQGARIGRDVMIGSVKVRVPSLLTIGDGASIGSSVSIENARVERGELVFGAVSVGQEGYVGSCVTLEGNTAIADWGRICGLSALVDGQTVGYGEIFDGSPACKTGEVDRSSRRPRPVLKRLRAAGEVLYFSLGGLAIAALFFTPIFPTFLLVDWMDGRLLSPNLNANLVSIAWEYFLLALPASLVLIACTILLSAAIRWMVLPRLKPGTSPVHGGLYYRKWLANQIQESSLTALHGLYASVFAPVWYRLLGARVGRDAEISTATGVVPDMLTLGDESFIADGVMLGDEEIDGGWMTLQPTVVGNRSFVGNYAYVADGSVLPDDVLIGVQSRPPENTQMKAGETWVGSPPLRLPAREVVSGFPVHLTARPSRARRLCRALVESTRIALPQAFYIGLAYAIILSAIPDAENGHWLRFAMDIGEAGCLCGLACYLLVLVLKWVLIGRYRPRTAAMWTWFVWRSEAVTSVYEAIAVPYFLNLLRGTPMIVPCLRLFGTKIGRGAFIDTTDLGEFDCVTIGDYTEINADAGPQTHLFEDRIMKIGEVHIGAQASLRAHAVVLYNASVGDHATLGPLTVVMKGERIPPATFWRGCPAQPWEVSPPSCASADESSCG